MKKFFVCFALFLAPLFSQAELQVETLGQEEKDQHLSYNFGSVSMNFRTYVDFIFSAKGPNASEIKKFTISGAGFDATTDCPIVIEVGTKCVVRAHFWPMFEGPAWGDLALYLNDGNIFIHLYGNGVRN